MSADSVIEDKAADETKPEPKKTVKAVETRRVVKPLEADIQRAEFARPDFRMIVKDVNTTPADVTKPEYWSHVGRILKGNGIHSFAHVELVWEDASRFMELLVLDADVQWAKVVVLRDIDLAGEADEVARLMEGENDDYEVKYRGPSAKWVVFRKSDEKALHSGYATKAAAIDKMKEHIATMTR